MKSEGEIAAPPIRFETNHNSQIYRKQNSNRDGYHYFGNAKVSNAISILPAIIREDCIYSENCEFHSEYGLFLSLNPKCLFPSAWVANQGVYLQVCQFGNKWKWRLIRSMPSHVGANNRPFDAVLRQVLENLEQALSRWISSGWNEVAGREITDLPQWCDPVDDACFNEKEPLAGIEALLTGTTLTIGFKNAPLRLEPTRLRVQHRDSKWIVELHEGQATAPETEGSSYQCQITQQEKLLPDGGWKVPVAPATTSAGPQGSGEKALWAHDTERNEWLRVGFDDYAHNNVAGETRRWPLGALLPEFPDQMELSLWLDNCGHKCLRLILDQKGEIKRLELALQRLYLDFLLDRRFWCDHKAPASPWVPGASAEVLHEVTAGQRVVLMNAAEDSASMELQIGKECALSSRAGCATHWLRTNSAIIGPADWAGSDPNAARGISALRGLIPFESDSWTLDLAKAAPQIDQDNYRYSELAARHRLLLATKAQAFLEVAIERMQDNTLDAVVRKRHASPYLDAYYAMTAFSTDGTTTQRDRSGETLTWARDRYLKPVEGESVELLALLTGEGLDQFHFEAATRDPDSPCKEWIPRCDEVGDLLRVLWYPNWLRWSAVPSESLRRAIGETLQLEPFRMAASGNAIESASFAIRPLSFDEQADVLKHGELQWNAASPLRLTGSLTLNATWLAEHHADLSPIQWAESIDSEIEFLGIESDAVALQSLNGALSLKSARYWFRQEGQEFTVKTDDTLLLKSGKWQLHSTSAHLVIEKATIETPAVGTFRYETALASGLSVTEALLPAENEPVLKITYAGKDLEVDVRTSYYDRTSSIPTKALAVLRAGTYHLAWAGRLATGAQETGLVKGLTLAELTRVFIRLSRTADGELQVRGMIGWRCAYLELGSDRYASLHGRATLYAHSPGAWVQLRMSGCWKRDARGSQELCRSAVVLPRQNFEVSGTSGDQIKISKALTPYFLAEYVRKKETWEQRAFCYQSFKIGEGLLSPQGRVCFAEYSRNNNPHESRMRMSALDLRWHDARQIRDNFIGEETSWVAVDIPETGMTPLESLSASEKIALQDEVIQPRGITQQPDIALAGLTCLHAGERWLLCEVTKAEDRALPDMRPRLWLLHQDGEDMIELEGFVEKLGTNKFDLKKCLTVAEQMLAFMRWRAPAVLEYWGEGSPHWLIVDAPLLNPFSDLSFMDPPRSGLGRTPSRTAGLIRADALPGILSSDIFSLNLVAPTAPTTESYLRARLTANMGRREGCLSLGREIEFEGGQEFSLRDGGAWVSDSVPRAEHEGFDRDPPWRRILPDTDWAFASPRPGERLSVDAETLAFDDDDQRLNSKFTLTSVRSPVDVSESEPHKFQLMEQSIRWPVGAAKLPSEAPIEGTNLQVLLWEPGVAALHLNESFPFAVTRLETEQTEAPQKVALAFHLNRSFILAVEAVGKAVASEADGLFHAFVTISPAAFDKVHTVLIETTESANSTGQEMPSRLTISAVSSDDQDPPLPIVSAGTHDGEPKKEYPLLTEPRQPTAMPLSAALKDNGGKVLAYGPVELTHEIELVDQHPCWRAYSSWSAKNSATKLEQIDQVLLFGHGGSVTEYSKA